MSSTLLQSINEWNLILYILGLLSIIGLAIFIERFASLQRAEIDLDLFLIDLKQKIGDQQILQAKALCDETKSPIGRIIKAGLSRLHNSKEHIEQGMEMVGTIEVATLEKNAKILSMISHLGPLIGLLGTVLGFIQAFAHMRMSGLMDISATKIGEAMESALLTTAAGLAVAIPAVIAYNYLVSRIQTFVLEMQTICSEVIDLIQTKQEEW